MTKLITLLLLIISFSSYCKPGKRMKADKQKSSITWQVSKRTASGKHNYHVPGFGYRANCKTYNVLPIKDKNFKRLAFHKRST